MKMINKVSSLILDYLFVKPFELIADTISKWYLPLMALSSLIMVALFVGYLMMFIRYRHLLFQLFQ
jgi:hypothetical protein